MVRMMDQGVGVRHAGGQAMIAVKADFAGDEMAALIADATRASFPPKCLVSVAGGARGLWMAPDEVLLMVPLADAPDLLGKLRRASEERHMLVEDVSDMRAVFAIEGAAVRDVLARVTPADVSPAALPVARVRRTRIGQVAGAVWLEDEASARVLCFRSVGQYMLDLLKDAADGPPLDLYHRDVEG